MAAPYSSPAPEPTSRLNDKTLAGIGASVVAAIVVGSVCTWLEVSSGITSTLTGGAVGVPAALEYRMQSRRRDPELDAARIEQGEFNRPIGLVVVLFIGAVFLIDSLAGAAKGASFGVLMAFDVNLNPDVAGVIQLILMCVTAAIVAFVAAFASHYLGAHPYLWVTVSVVIVLAFRLLIVVPFQSPAQLRENWTISNIVLAHALFLIGCLIGVRYGRKHHARFLKRKLVRVRGSGVPGSTAPQRPSLPPPNPLDRRLN